MHTFKNFKNFEYAEIDLSKPMTLLIGRNGSGKSNVIEGVELLAELIKGREIHEISDIRRGGQFEVRGSLNGCFKQGAEIFEIGFKDKVSFDKNQQAINYEIIGHLKPVLKIEKKALVDNKNLLEITKKYSDNPNSKNFKLCAGLIGGLGLLGFLSYQLMPTDKKETNDVDTRILAGISASLIGAVTLDYLVSQKTESQNLIDKYIDTHVFDIYPRIMRQYSPIGLNKLNRTGENISSVLYYLKQNEPDILESILKLIKQLPEEEFVSFEFITTSNNSDVLFALKYPNGEIISTKLLSDGTLRALAILTALETVPEGSRIIIEEIDNGVHASRVHVLIDAIWEASNRRHLNTLITTHNPATLDSLKDEQLESVVVCHYDKQSQSAKLTPFFELPRVYELMERGKLGSLVVRNIIEQYLDPDFEKEQQRIMDEWVESLT